MLLIIAIVGTTVAPWQLFFQQSYVIDKRITPRFLRYGSVDLVMGIVLVLIGGIAMMAFSAAAFAGRSEAGHFRTRWVWRSHWARGRPWRACVLR
jgi:Mn2+/Fe2+ NRAMP family transporter